MTRVELDAWTVHTVRGFAQQLVTAGLRSEADAGGYARRQFDQLLPAGLATPLHHLWTVRAVDDSATVLGRLWMRVALVEGETEAYVLDVELEPEARGRGLGRATLTAAERTARDLGAQVVRLNVFAHNVPARRLYDALGYTVLASTLTRPGKPGHRGLGTRAPETRGAAPVSPPLGPASLGQASLGQASLGQASLDPASLDPASLDPATLDPATLDPATLDPASGQQVALLAMSETEYDELLPRLRTGPSGGWSGPGPAGVDPDGLLVHGPHTPGHLLWTARDGEQRVGHLWLALQDRPDGRHAVGLHVGVRPDLRGRGYGRAVVGAAERALRQRAVVSVTASVPGEAIAVRSLLERTGFELTAQTREKRL